MFNMNTIPFSNTFDGQLAEPADEGSTDTESILCLAVRKVFRLPLKFKLSDRQEPQELNPIYF